MADGQHLKSVKSQYCNNGLTDRQETWHDDKIGPMNITLPPHTLRLLFCIIKMQNLILKQKRDSVSLLVKAASLKQQMSKFYLQIISAEASFYIYDRPLIVH